MRDLYALQMKWGWGTGRAPKVMPALKCHCSNAMSSDTIFSTIFFYSASHSNASLPVLEVSNILLVECLYMHSASIICKNEDIGACFCLFYWTDAVWKASP